MDIDKRMLLIIFVVVCCFIASAVGAYFYIEQNKSSATEATTSAAKTATTTAPDASTTAPAKSESLDPCFGLTDSTPASQISLSCLQKTWKDAGCKESGAFYPKNLTGWWSQDNGAGTYRVVKNDMKAYTGENHINECIGTAPVAETTAPAKSNYTGITPPKIQRVQAPCNAGYYDSTNGSWNYWDCGANCEGGKYYTDGSCRCACKPNVAPTTTSPPTTTPPKIQRVQAPCNAGYYDSTNGSWNIWECGANCEGGKYYTDGGCNCACKPK